MIRGLICDDSPELRLLLRAQFDAAGDIAAVRDSAADVIVLDLSMPRSDGLQVLAPPRAAAPELGIAVLSGFDRTRLGARAIALGADRYLEKTCGSPELLAAVRAAATSRKKRAASRAAPSPLEPCSPASGYPRAC